MSNTATEALSVVESPSRLIDARIKELADWRGKTLSHVRALIKQADPGVVEEWKWRGVPVGLFNSSLEGNTRRAIDIHEGDEIDEGAFKTLVRAAAALNRSSAR
jgi:hypothetical protein